MSRSNELPPLTETIAMADELAHNTRLDNPLPVDTDFSPVELKAVQTQLNAIAILPRRTLDPIYIAFSAKHLPSLASALRALSLTTQRKAFSTLIQILSLLPDPKVNPYFRKFLASSLCDGLPTLIASAFVQGIEWMRPSGPGHLCTLIVYTLFWCDVDMDDDKCASVDQQVRKDLARKLELMRTSEDFARMEARQRAEVKRLVDVLFRVEHMPEGLYLAPLRDFLFR